MFCVFLLVQTYILSLPEQEIYVIFTAKTSFSDQNTSTVVGVVVSIPIFHLFLQNHGAKFKHTEHKAFFKFIHYFKEPQSFPRGDNNEIMILDLQVLKIFSRTTRPISTKHGTKHPWVKRFKFAQINYSILNWEIIAFNFRLTVNYLNFF